MTDYRVTWEIDVIADSCLEAARMARDIQTKPGTTAVVFDVHSEGDQGDPERVDLLEGPFRCTGCGRLEEECSADPCKGVIADREATDEASLNTPMRSAVETASFALSRYRETEDEEELDNVEDALDELMQMGYDPAKAVETPLDPNHQHLAQALRQLAEKLRSLSIEMPASVYVRFREALLDADEALENYKKPQQPEKPQVSWLTIKTDQDRSIPVKREECAELFRAFDEFEDEDGQAGGRLWEAVITAAEKYLTDTHDDGDDNIVDVIPD